MVVGSPARIQVNSGLSRYWGCHEEVEVYRVTDRCDLEGRRSQSRTQRVDQEAWDQPCDLLQLASEARLGERLGAEADEGAQGSEREELWRRYKAGETVLGIANALGQRTTNLYRVLQASEGIALVKVCLGPATHDSQD